MSCECTVETLPGRLRHPPREKLPRHRHDRGFAAVILGGSYVEAGDRGRMRVSAGDVIFHGAFESHLDDVAPTGADVLVLPWHGAIVSPLGRVDDPDALVRAAERNVALSSSLVVTQLAWSTVAPMDWPDRLAAAIRTDPSLHLETWAEREGLRPETISRGFRRAYGVTAVAYRARIRLLNALRALSSGASLARIAADCGFADQAHLTRGFGELTAMSPAAWRRAARD